MVSHLYLGVFRYRSKILPYSRPCRHVNLTNLPCHTWFFSQVSAQKPLFSVFSSPETILRCCSSITILRISVFHGRKFLIFKLLYLLSPNLVQIFSSPDCLVPLSGMYILVKTASIPKLQFNLNASAQKWQLNLNSSVPKLRKSNTATCNHPSPNL